MTPQVAAAATSRAMITDRMRGNHRSSTSTIGSMRTATIAGGDRPGQRLVRRHEQPLGHDRQHHRHHRQDRRAGGDADHPARSARVSGAATAKRYRSACTRRPQAVAGRRVRDRRPMAPGSTRSGVPPADGRRGGRRATPGRAATPRDLPAVRARRTRRAGGAPPADRRRRPVVVRRPGRGRAPWRWPCSRSPTRPATSSPASASACWSAWRCRPSSARSSGAGRRPRGMAVTLVGAGLTVAFAADRHDRRPGGRVAAPGLQRRAAPDGRATSTRGRSSAPASRTPTPRDGSRSGSTTRPPTSTTPRSPTSASA